MDAERASPIPIALFYPLNVQVIFERVNFASVSTDIRDRTPSWCCHFLLQGYWAFYVPPALLPHGAFPPRIMPAYNDEDHPTVVQEAETRQGLPFVPTRKCRWRSVWQSVLSDAPSGEFFNLAPSRSNKMWSTSGLVHNGFPKECLTSNN